MVATFRGSDTSAKEVFYHHAAGWGGLAGYGGSSYIDSVIFRDRDDNSGWTSAADGVLEERRYLCQNWRADVSVVLTDVCEQVESVKYFSYGLPVCLPAGDVDADGDTDGADETLVKGWEGGTYRARADINLDGVIDSSDTTLVNALAGKTGGRGVLSRADTCNRVGYAGYQSDFATGARLWHVRYRVLDSVLQRWTRRDPAGYVDGASLLNYVQNRPIFYLDSSGRCCSLCMTVCAVIVAGAGGIGALGCATAFTNPISIGLCIALFAGSAMIAGTSCPAACGPSPAGIGCCVAAAIPPVVPTPTPTPITPTPPTSPDPKPPRRVDCNWRNRLVQAPLPGTPAAPGSQDPCKCSELYLHNSGICGECTNMSDRVLCIERAQDIDSRCHANCVRHAPTLPSPELPIPVSPGWGPNGPWRD